MAKILKNALDNNFSILLLGPKQTGKTTLIKEFLLPKRKNVLEYSSINPSTRLSLETNPEKLIYEVQAKNYPLVFIDEIQKVPALLDAVQYSIDNKKALFILTGSSARKLRGKSANLLAGRVLSFNLTPFTWNELGILPKNYLNLQPELKQLNNINIPLEEQLLFGSLPPVLLTKEPYKNYILQTYAQLYLEQEIRQESLVRKIGAFGRFLELAAAESGSAPNFTLLSQQTGVSVPAIRKFFQILDDTLIVKRLDPYLKSPMERLFSRPKYYFFDIGVRNSVAKLPLNNDLLKTQKGILFEHFVILELFRRARLPDANFKLYWWRTLDGAEVDCVIERDDGNLILLEIKASNIINLNRIKELTSFLKTHNKAKIGYVVSLVERPRMLLLFRGG